MRGASKTMRRLLGLALAGWATLAGATDAWARTATGLAQRAATAIADDPSAI